MLWVPPKIFPTLELGVIHVWRASLRRSAEETQHFFQLLNPKEQERSAKFVVKNAANSFIVARGILRELLAKYLSVAPRDLVFDQNKYGKLYLQSAPIQFNLSHSHDLSLFAFTLHNPIGIDVEYIRNDYKYADIAKKFFSTKEATELSALPRSVQLSAFFNCWTCKEAFIKAKGCGMFLALDKFSVEITTKRTGRVGLVYPDDGVLGAAADNYDWLLEALDPAREYAGALVVGGKAKMEPGVSYALSFYQT